MARMLKRKELSHSAELSTRDRILEASRTLFNRNGVQGTALFRIASHLSISPGNLTYHFASKSDLVRELAVDLERQIVGTLNQLTSPLHPREVLSAVEENLQTMWSARFFFNSALFVSKMDKDLAKKFQQVYNALCTDLHDYLEKLIARREMKAPPGPDGIRLLSDNVVAVWLQWLRLQAISTPDAVNASKSAIGTCLRHHFALMAPYMSRGFTEAIWEEIEKRY